MNVDTNDAVIIMGRYGFGIANPRYHGRSKRAGGEKDVNGNEVQQMDFWLVEEIPSHAIAPDGSVRLPQAPQTNSGNQKRVA